MKTMMNTITYPAFALFAFACFALSPQAGAQQCQQGCDLDNTFLGNSALSCGGCSQDNTVVGAYALTNYIDAIYAENTAVGAYALESNTTGHDNIAVGYRAGSNLTTGSNNIDIGALGSAGDANTIRIGRSGIQTKAFMQGIRGATVANGVGVIVGTTGQLGTVQSSKRFKEAIQPMDQSKLSLQWSKSRPRKSRKSARR